MASLTLQDLETDLIVSLQSASQAVDTLRCPLPDMVRSHTEKSLQDELDTLYALLGARLLGVEEHKPEEVK